MYNINRRSGKVRFFVTAAVCLACSVVFALGKYYGSKQAEQMVDVKDAILAERSQPDLEPQLRNQMDAIAIRLGQMQSQILRLNAIGQRMVDELDIGQSEFDFSGTPGMGGSDAEIAGDSLSYHALLKHVDAFSTSIHDQEIQLELLNELVVHRKIEGETVPSGRPVKSGWLSSTYGWRIDPFSGKSRFHSGVDFAGQWGTEVMAVASGVIVLASRNGGYGNMVTIDHGNGYVTRYGHNNDLTVVVGERVEKGDVIAHMGSTGRATGTHVHFEVLRHDRTVNPVKFMRRGS